MKKAGSDKKEAAPVPPARASVKGESAKPPLTKAPEPQHEEQEHLDQKWQWPSKKTVKDNCKEYCAVIFYILLGVLTILISVAVIIVTGLASVATKVYDAEQSSRLVAMIVLAVTAAISLSVAIYAIIGAVRKHIKPVHATGVVLIILVIIQSLIIGLAIKITSKDELSIGKSLSESFRLAKEDNPRHVKLWASTQNDLQCCGVYGPEDYRDPNMPYYFPPNVPVSCCPAFDKDKPAYNQEREREVCKAKGTYYDNGCKGLIVEVFQETSVVVIGVLVLLIVFEVLLAIQGAILIKRHKRQQHLDHAECGHK